MSVQILGAFFGDNLARRDVTQSLKSKVSGGTLDVTANEELIPAFEVSEETKLSPNELADIDKKAQEQCSGGADSDCIRATKAKLMQQKHEEKANTDTSSANTIVGRALTVNYRDANNVIKRVVVPDGQKLKLDGVEFTNKQGKPEPMKWDEYQKVVMDGLGWAVWTAVFVFSAASSYRVFKRYGNLPIAIAITIFAILLPLGGAPAYIGIIFIIAINAFMEMGRQSKAASAVAPAASAALPANPLAALQGAVSNPLAALQGATSNPLAALQGAAANPLTALKGAAANPLTALKGTSPPSLVRLRATRHL
jgi:hypothetical protein